jgi:ATP-dependent Clp protease ATP-binding subunit ClpA
VTEHQGELIFFIDEVHTIVGAGQVVAKAGWTWPTSSNR